MGKLTVMAIRSLRTPGRYADGEGLYLQVAPGGSRQWLFRFKLNGRERLMGLGPVGDPPAKVPLIDARQRAAEARGLLRGGTDPIEARDACKKTRDLERRRAELHTFQATAEAYIAAREQEWRNEKHRAQWSSTLEAYAYPKIGEVPVSAVDTGAVLSVLTPIWHAKPETASRLRGRIESILDYARSLELRTGENPARWRGHLTHSLAKPGKLRPVRHHAALPWQSITSFMASLQADECMAARALQFAILTAARSGEVLGARWQELELDAGLWTIPSDRMKAGREHRVPLTPPAIAILKLLQPLARDRSHPIFAGRHAAIPFSGMALEMLIRRMNGHVRQADGFATTAKTSSKVGDRGKPRWADRDGRPITPHGFRSTFRDWVGEASSHSTDLAEAALAHVVRDKTVAAYARGDLFAKRRKLMLDWAEYCLPGSTTHD